MTHKPTIKLTPDGDLSRECFTSRSGLLHGREATKQELKVLLKTVRGEDPFDEQHGLRVFEVTTQSIRVLEREIKLALRSDERVERVMSCDGPSDSESLRVNREVDIRVVVELTGHEEPVDMEVTV